MLCAVASIHYNQNNTASLPTLHRLTCLPPPLLGWVLEEMEGPDAPPPVLFPVQLLHRISPWFPFFHIDEEFVLHTAQHGFKPSGIVDCQRKDEGINNEEKQLLLFVKLLRPVLVWLQQMTKADRFYTTSYDIRLQTITLTTLNGNLDCWWSRTAAIVVPLFLLLR